MKRNWTLKYTIAAESKNQTAVGRGSRHVIRDKMSIYDYTSKYVIGEQTLILLTCRMPRYVIDNNSLSTKYSSRFYFIPAYLFSSLRVRHTSVEISVTGVTKYNLGKDIPKISRWVTNDPASVSRGTGKWSLSLERVQRRKQRKSQPA